jgi:hypothetical protein
MVKPYSAAGVVLFIALLLAGVKRVNAGLHFSQSALQRLS